MAARAGGRLTDFVAGGGGTGGAQLLGGLPAPPAKGTDARARLGPGNLLFGKAPGDVLVQEPHPVRSYV